MWRATESQLQDAKLRRRVSHYLQHRERNTSPVLTPGSISVGAVVPFPERKPEEGAETRCPESLLSHGRYERSAPANPNCMHSATHLRIHGGAGKKGTPMAFPFLLLTCQEGRSVLSRTSQPSRRCWAPVEKKRSAVPGEYLYVSVRVCSEVGWTE